MKGHCLMEGREQEWEGRMSPEQEGGFYAVLPWSLFPEVFKWCFESLGGWAQIPTDKSDVLSAASACSCYVCSLGFIWGSKDLLNTHKWPAYCFGGVGIITLILINTDFCHSLAQGKGRTQGSQLPITQARVDDGCFSSMSSDSMITLCSG